MRPLLPDEIRQAVHGVWTNRGIAEKTIGVSIDSRTAERGQLFIAIRGPKHDGHDYLLDAAKAGCISAIVERGTPLRLRVSYYPGSFEIELPSEVVRTTPTGFAVRFTSLDAESRRLLAKVLLRCEDGPGPNRPS